MARLIGLPKQTGRGGGVGSTVTIQGIPQLLAKLETVKNVARLELGLLSAGAATHMLGRAKEYCPVITGNLKSSIKMEKLGSYTYQVTASSREGDNPAKNGKEYAGYVEFGRLGMAPRFFMTRAYQETRVIVLSDLQLVARRLEAL